MVLPANDIQRLAPFTSTPNFSVSHSRTMRDDKHTERREARLPVSEERRRDQDRQRDQRRTSAWRMMKCHGPRPSRSATGGLAAKLSTMPTSISRISAGQQLAVDRPPPFGERGLPVA